MDHEKCCDCTEAESGAEGRQELVFESIGECGPSGEHGRPQWYRNAHEVVQLRRFRLEVKIPNQQQSLAIGQLQRYGQAWEFLLAWLRDNYANALHECARADGEIAVRRLQGEVRTLKDIIGALEPKQ